MQATWKGVIHYELLPPGKTISSDLYCQQLMRLEQELEKKRPKLINSKGVVFYHDNARPHTSLITQQIVMRVWLTGPVSPPRPGPAAPRARKRIEQFSRAPVH
ncbi:Histone-lysine N-methyltransferase SETMAR [Eumeta japonica]|uniref:Histone-lysine N-methyltransferase SETMAR n=1 Tax=Eumeta variegata TaxID=151549 RepID=A0A4C1W720_EUMVA|nr:Histone-lysine N-methyltransferase SETMAR [Eumeta japonica]